MKYLFLAFCLMASTAAAQQLTWPELAQRPEFWPAECTLIKAMKFRAGGSVEPGQKLDVVEIQSSQIVLGTKDGKTTFATKPEDTDALAAARAQWEKLTPAQRELTYRSLLRRSELWPYRVTLTLPMELSGNIKVAKGEQVVLLGVEGAQLLVLAEKVNTSFTVDPQQTDLIAGARKALEGRGPASSRLGDELQGKLLDPVSAKPGTLPSSAATRYYVFYRGAGWCGPCREFSPTLVKTYKDLKAKHPDFELVFLSADHSDAEMKKYVKEEGFPWLAVTSERVKELRLVTQYLGTSIPQLVVLDRGGKMLVNSDQVGRPAALKQLAALLKEPAK